MAAEGQPVRVDVQTFPDPRSQSGAFMASTTSPERGFVSVGDSHDTRRVRRGDDPALVAEVGSLAYPDAERAPHHRDAGGSNSYLALGG